MHFEFLVFLKYHFEPWFGNLGEGIDSNSQNDMELEVGQN